MSFAKRCPFCNAVIAGPGDYMEFHAFLTLHIVKCDAVPRPLTYSAAVQVAQKVMNNEGGDEPN